MAKKSVHATAISAQTLNLFRLQFSSEDGIPPEVHRAAARMAKKSANVDLLATLAARPDAPADLLQEYRTMPEIPIRIAYLSRPEHSEATLKAELKSEKRAGVLAELVNRPEVDKALLDMVGEVFCEKPTVKLAEALLGLDVTPKVRLKAFEVLAPRFDGAGSALQSALVRVAQLIAASPLRDQGAKVATSSTLAGHFLSVSGLSAEARIALLDSAVLPVLELAKSTVRSHGRTYHGTYAVRGVLGALNNLLSCSDLQDEVVAHILTVSDHPALLKDERTHLRSAVTAYDPVAGGASSQAGTATGALLEDMVALAVKGDESLAITLLTNPALTSEQAQVLVSRFRNRPALENMARSAPERVLDEIAFLDTQAFQKAGGFDLFADPAAAMLRLVARATIQWRSEGRRVSYHSPLSRLAVLPLSQEAVLSFPWAYVVTTQFGYYIDRSSIALAQQISLAQAQVLGASEAAWETFNSLGENFEGTVGELLETTAALTPA